MKEAFGVPQHRLSESTLGPLAERAIAMARSVPKDPHAGLADPALLARDWPKLDLVDTSEPDAESLMARALEAEDAARAVAGVTNSEGAGAGWRRREVTPGHQRQFRRPIRVWQPLDQRGGPGRRRHRDGARLLVVVGSARGRPGRTPRRSAAAPASARCVASAPRKAQSGQVPVLYDPRIAGGLLSHLAGAISGPSIARGTSFLKDALETAVFAAGITVVDDPHRVRGLSSRPFDGEGVATERCAIIADGVLQTWLLDSRSGPPARPCQHRPCRARDQRAAVARLFQPLAGTGRRQRRGAHRRRGERPLRHRADRHGREPGDRRL